MRVSNNQHTCHSPAPPFDPLFAAPRSRRPAPLIFTRTSVSVDSASSAASGEEKGGRKEDDGREGRKTTAEKEGRRPAEKEGRRPGEKEGRRQRRRKEDDRRRRKRGTRPGDKKDNERWHTLSRCFVWFTGGGVGLAGRARQNQRARRAPCDTSDDGTPRAALLWTGASKTTRRASRSGRAGGRARKSTPQEEEERLTGGRDTGVGVREHNKSSARAGASRSGRARKHNKSSARAGASRASGSATT